MDIENRLKEKIFEILTKGTDYDEVPYSEINRPRYLFLLQQTNRYLDEILKIIDKKG